LATVFFLAVVFFFAAFFLATGFFFAGINSFLGQNNALFYQNPGKDAIIAGNFEWLSRFYPASEKC
jgi:hypothetical protein